MSEILRQPVVVENQVGASGNLGSRAVARSQPDGYTLLFSTNVPLTINVGLFRNLGYDPVQDLQGVALVCKVSSLISGNSSLPAKNIADIISMAKKAPGKLSLGHGGIGTGGHFAIAELNKLAGINIVQVPYRGTAQAVTDTAAGIIDLSSADLVGMLPFIQSGKIRALGTAGAQRLPQLPDVPTVASLPYPGSMYPCGSRYRLQQGRPSKS